MSLSLLWPKVFTQCYSMNCLESRYVIPGRWLCKAAYFWSAASSWVAMAEKILQVETTRPQLSYQGQMLLSKLYNYLVCNVQICLLTDRHNWIMLWVSTLKFEFLLYWVCYIFCMSSALYNCNWKWKRLQLMWPPAIKIKLSPTWLSILFDSFFDSVTFTLLL